MDNAQRTATAAATITINPANTGGVLWAWGRGDYGQLGTGASTDTSVPVQVSGLTDVTAIASGDSTGDSIPTGWMPPATCTTVSFLVRVRDVPGCKWGGRRG